jgi:hypothetical protein
MTHRAKRAKAHSTQAETTAGFDRTERSRVVMGLQCFGKRVDKPRIILLAANGYADVSAGC